MRLSAELSAPWAILPEKLVEIQSIAVAHAAGHSIDIAAVEARIGKPLENQAQGYDVIDGVAIVPVEGVIAPKMNMLSQISGGASHALVRRDIAAALVDPQVHSIVMAVDSPGGTVAGTDNLAQFIAAARGAKPIIAWTAGTMASAAYWIGSAADSVQLGDKNATLGSIGVVAKHVDVSRAQEAAGVKTTEIVAGKYKRVASEYGPLTEEGRAHLQDQVDAYYANFVDAVAQHRSRTATDVVATMAEGRVFIGQQAIDAGLADGITSLEALIASLNQQAADRRLQQLRSPSMDITKDRVVAEFPEIAAALRSEGAQSERDRIADVRAQVLPGHEALIERLAFDGKTTGAQAASAVLAAEREVRQSQAAALANDAPAPVAFVGSQSGSAPARDPEKESAQVVATARRLVEEGRASSFTEAVRLAAASKE